MTVAESFSRSPSAMCFPWLGFEPFHAWDWQTSFVRKAIKHGFRVSLRYSPCPLLPLAAKCKSEMKWDESLGTFIPTPAKLFISGRFSSEQWGSRQCGKQQMRDPQAPFRLAENTGRPLQSLTMSKKNKYHLLPEPRAVFHSPHQPTVANPKQTQMVNA